MLGAPMAIANSRLRPWQVGILILPIAGVISFLLVAASWQINAWHLNWIWAVVVLIFLGWRWLLVRWTAPLAAPNGQTSFPTISLGEATADVNVGKIEQALNEILQASRQDVPAWQDWPLFWQRCQQVVTVVAQTYYPEVKYPLLNIYVPDAYGLIRGTVDDMDRWVANLSPTLNQVSLAQVYQSYEVYQKLEPSLRKIWQVWYWGQWVLNPVAAAARLASQQSNQQATQQLLVNLSQQLREATLRTLCRQAIALYNPASGNLPDNFGSGGNSIPGLVKAKSQTLQNILAQGQSPQEVEQQPVNVLLVGRTGAGKSSLINALFQTNLAVTDLLPSTTEITKYEWRTRDGEMLMLWDSPGYEQGQRKDLRQLVLDYAQRADVILLLNPALDPALQMDADFVRDLQTLGGDRPLILLVTQVDRLRPVRQWQPPYNWRSGEQAKEKSIREAVQYRVEQLGQYCEQVLPVVSGDEAVGRSPWGLEELSVALVTVVSPAQQQRLARFLRNLEARSLAAAQIIDRYALQMTTTQGVTALLKSPVLQFVSSLTTGSPALAYLLAEQIPIEQLPLVLGKLQLAYDLFNLLAADKDDTSFDLLTLWPLLLDNPVSPDRNAWAFGHALLEYWTQNLTVEQLGVRFRHYCELG
ncbi:GTPase family protein [Synechocystis sp. CACIAM 05]|uniref:GTPase family protein n=1 Tax=Synechocystis sp. CACIAM 05 TaxID=1933929 RepID=UPI001F3E4E8E|nr:GTPase family protein [Synechocystis sp. CACIAM 05]